MKDIDSVLFVRLLAIERIFHKKKEIKYEIEENLY